MLPSAFYPDSPRFSLGGWLALFNFKANHRKVVLTEKAGLVTSANNSHDASAANSNIAFAFSGPLLADLLKSEQAAASLSGYNLNLSLPPSPEANAEVIKLQLLTEAKIKEVLLDDLDHCQPPATIWIAMFYLADRQVIAALLAAARRGVVVNLILDANRDAFGHHKNGVPNKPVAAWLKKKSGDGLQIRWYDSHGEQFHSKLVMLTSPERTMVMGGSANLTRRNIAGFNLETSLRIIGPPEHAFNQQVLSYFLRLWNNEGGNFTLEYETCADANLLKYLQYQVQERTGLSSF
jgi:phosphatidylserine/phosphatidylglycerophosphate/cardiolipin synthase-like enzyme